jgi:hypothetical protein
LLGLKPELNVLAWGFGALLPKLVRQACDIVMAWLLLNGFWHIDFLSFRCVNRTSALPKQHKNVPKAISKAHPDLPKTRHFLPMTGT